MIPDFQSTMLPLLKILGDRKQYKRQELVSIISKQFELSDAEKIELIQSGLGDYLL
jgi:restriction system protein